MAHDSASAPEGVTEPKGRAAWPACRARNAKTLPTSFLKSLQEGKRCAVEQEGASSFGLTTGRKVGGAGQEERAACRSREQRRLRRRGCSRDTRMAWKWRRAARSGLTDGSCGSEHLNAAKREGGGERGRRWWARSSRLQRSGAVQAGPAAPCNKTCSVRGRWGKGRCRFLSRCLGNPALVPLCRLQG